MRDLTPKSQALNTRPKPPNPWVWQLATKICLIATSVLKKSDSIEIFKFGKQKWCFQLFSKQSSILFSLPTTSACPHCRQHPPAIRTLTSHQWPTAPAPLFPLETPSLCQLLPPATPSLVFKTSFWNQSIATCFLFPLENNWKHVYEFLKNKNKNY